MSAKPVFSPNPGRGAMNVPCHWKPNTCTYRHVVPMGHRIDGWRVCWLGGWDKQRLFFIVMLVRVKE
jgi:hypothetical protein